MHCHAAMTLLRGFADDVSLEDWLSQYIWPAEGRWIGEEYIEDGTKVARTHTHTHRRTRAHAHAHARTVM